MNQSCKVYSVHEHSKASIVVHLLLCWEPRDFTYRSLMPALQNQQKTAASSRKRFKCQRYQSGILASLFAIAKLFQIGLFVKARFKSIERVFSIRNHSLWFKGFQSFLEKPAALPFSIKKKIMLKATFLFETWFNQKARFNLVKMFLAQNSRPKANSQKLFALKSNHPNDLISLESFLSKFF